MLSVHTRPRACVRQPLRFLEQAATRLGLWEGAAFTGGLFLLPRCCFCRTAYVPPSIRTSFPPPTHSPTSLMILPSSPNCPFSFFPHPFPRLQNHVQAMKGILAQPNGKGKAPYLRLRGSAAPPPPPPIRSPPTTQFNSRVSRDFCTHPMIWSQQYVHSRRFVSFVSFAPPRPCPRRFLPGCFISRHHSHRLPTFAPLAPSHFRRPLSPLSIASFASRLPTNRSDVPSPLATSSICPTTSAPPLLVSLRARPASRAPRFTLAPHSPLVQATTASCARRARSAR